MTCPYCGIPSVWTDNSVIYGKKLGTSYMIYYCKPCDAYVGCHNNSRVPLGTMANAELRHWRILAHSSFDPIWKRRNGKRSKLYREISRDLGFDVHIGESDISTCMRIVSWCEEKKKKINTLGWLV